MKIIHRLDAEFQWWNLFCNYAFAFADDNLAVNAGNVYRFDASARPSNLQFVDFFRCAEPDADALVGLRSITRAAENIEALPEISDRHENNRADCIARRFFR